MPGRTDNEIKNLWHTHIKKKLGKMGTNPLAHKPRPSDHLPTDDNIHQNHDAQPSEESREVNEQEQDKLQENEGMSLWKSLYSPTLMIIHPQKTLQWKLTMPFL